MTDFPPFTSREKRAPVVGRNGNIGSSVEKINGYKFPGEIRAVYTTRKGELRYVVECTAEGADGCQHIFNGEQLRFR